jgi:hypothetical protein
MKKVIGLFDEIKILVSKGLIGSDELILLIKSLYDHSIELLSNYNEKHLTSKVLDKDYFSYSKNGKISRAINKNLYKCGDECVDNFFKSVEECVFDSTTPHDITAACYNIAISFCAVIDINKSGDQKTPGTYFEYFIGCLFSRRLGVKPTKKLSVLNLDMEATLPTDFIFDLGKDKPKFHVPVKTSTRERVIQVWAHQRVLDGVYGAGRFLGTLTCLSETKTNKKNYEVVEICLPTQWRLYQMYISQLKRVYYLDKPQAYAELSKVFPKIHVADFGSFFYEAENLLD